MRRMRSLLLASLLCLAGPARAGVVDRVVLVVEDDLVLESEVRLEAVLTPLDLVPGGDIDTPAVINIDRLLQSLDALPPEEAQAPIEMTYLGSAIWS